MLHVKNLSKVYGGRGAVKAIDNLTFHVEDGEFVCLVGPSGCGKTTLLKCLSGLLPATTGTAELDGKLIAGPPKELALVFQEYGRSLYPWLTVGGNVILPLKNKGIERQETESRARQALDAVGLESFVDRHPWELSGGMQQRVAIARALAYQPSILLMDEPFASVDAQTRADLEDLLLRVWEEFTVTVLFVTHDIDEAVYLADRVIVLTPPPASIKEVIAVDMARPRDQVTTKEEPTFAHLRGHVFRLIMRDEDVQREDEAAAVVGGVESDSARPVASDGRRL